MNVLIPYKPRKWAQRLHDSTQRFKVLVLHRRAGKTTAVLNHLQRDALLIPNSRFAYIAPTYKQSENIAWALLKDFARPIPGVDFNEQKLRVLYPNGSELRLYGADNPDSLRGIALWGCAFDEYSQQPPNIFGEIISKALADHYGYAIFLGTIKGKNQLYRTYEVAKTDPEKWYAVWQDVEESLRTEAGDTITNLGRALEDDRKLVEQGLMTLDEFEQEWYLSVDAAIKGAIYARELQDLRGSKRIGNVPYDRSLPVHTVWDLGKGANMAIGFYQHAYGQMRKIDYWEGIGDQALPEAIREVKNKPYVYGKHFAPHDIKAVDLSTGKTRLEAAKKLGIGFTVIPDIGVQNGINAAKLMFSRLWVNEETCRPWLDSIAQYRREWDENRGIFKDIPYHDWTSHGADEFRYAAVIADKMDNEMDGEVTQVIPTLDPY